MRYRRILVRNFRGIEESEITFSDGVTVVVGPNEAGKSSLREAIGLLRRYKDSSRSTAVRQVGPIGRDAAPFVELELEAGPYHLIYRKQWLRRPFTELEVRREGHAPQHFSGDDAHEQFGVLLSTTTDLDLLDQVDVGQGQSLEQARLVEVTALQQALGEAPGEARTDVLMDRVEREYRNYFTAGGRPTGRWRELTTMAEDIEGRLEQARSRYDEAQAFTHEYEDNAQVLARLRSMLADERERLADLAAQETKVKNRREELEAKQRDLHAQCHRGESLRHEQQRRRELREELESVASLVAAAEEDLADSVARHRDLTEAQEKAGRTADEADTAAKAARGALEEAQDRLDQQRRYRELRETVKLRERVEAATESLQSARATLSAARVDDEKWEEISACSRRLDLAEAAWRAGAPTVTITRVGSAPVYVSDQTGSDLTEGQAVTTEVFGSLTVSVPEVVEVEVRAGKSPEKLEEDVRQARSDLTDLLAGVDVTDVEQARTQHASFQRAQGEVERSEQSVRELAEEVTVEDLRLREAELRQALPTDGQKPLDPDEVARLEVDLARIREQEIGAAERRDTAHALWSAAKLQEELCAQREADLRVRVSELQERLKSLTASNAAWTSSHDEEALSLEIVQVDAASDALKKAVADLESELTSGAVEELEARLLNATQALESRRARVRELENRNLELQTLLEDRAGEGLFDRVQQLQAQAEHCGEELRATQRRAEASRLLRTVLMEEKERAQQRYVRPFAEGVSRLGRMVFGPDFSVGVDPDLTITSRTLDGVTIPFDFLSVGAKEQLSLLGRLACADLVEVGAGAPMILDDTLGYADAERLEGVNLILNKVGQQAQIIVLTCQEERFERVGSASVVRLRPAFGH